MVMKCRSVICALVTLVVVASRGEGDLGRYKVILDRLPFGQEPSPESLVTAAKPAPPAESLGKFLKMSAVTRNLLSGELQVGIIDVTAKKNYFLKVGETEDGIMVVEADYEGERALLRKDGAEAWVGMNDVVTMTTVAAGLPPQHGGSGVRPGGVRRGAAGRETIREVKVAAPKLSGEALAKHLENYQMDLIRAGGEKGPPLPMELTPEMDQQLVAEGVLPPME